MTKTIVVYAEPKGQPRVRPTSRGGKLGVFMPKTADAFRDAIIREWLIAANRVKFSGPVEVKVKAYFMPPKSKKRAAWTHHTAKPDGDNVLKAILDALTHAGVWDDDAGVYSMSIEKFYAAEAAFTHISITGETVPL